MFPMALVVAGTISLVQFCLYRFCRLTEGTRPDNPFCKLDERCKQRRDELSRKPTMSNKRPTLLL
jgi:hypothetical protein